MKKKVLILSSSLRSNSNSEILAKEFARGAVMAGHDAELISLRDKEINFCRGCLVCQTTKQCVIKDDASKIAQNMSEADVIAFVTPIYYYEMSGQLKTLLDRTNPLFSTDYSFRDIYLLAAAAEAEQSAVDGAVNGIKGWIECFAKTELKGVLLAGGVTMPGDIDGAAVLKQAYEMGTAI